MGQAYTESLSRKHAQLDDKIEMEMHRPHPDETRLHALKKEKLRLKDAISASG